MDHLLHYIRKEVAYTSSSGTIYLDLPKGAKISQLVLELDIQRNGTRDADMSVLHAIQKIHILLDGAKVAYSMQPEVGSFDYLYRAGQQPPHQLGAVKNTHDIMRLPILFGRYPYDLEYGLDTARYGSAAVEIEYNIDATAYQETTLTLTAYIMVPVAPVNYRGFIRARIIEDKATPTASSVHTTDLPSTFPLLAAFCRIYDFDKYPHQGVTDLDFQAEQGRHRIFEGRIEDLYTLNEEIFGRDCPSPYFSATIQHDDWACSFMGRAWRGVINQYEAVPKTLSISSFYGSRVSIHCSTASADVSVMYRVFGTAPWSCLILGDWRKEPFNAPAHADLLCNYTVGTAPEFLTTCVLEVVEGTL